MKCQAEFSPEKKINMSSAAVVIRTLGIKSSLILVYHLCSRMSSIAFAFKKVCPKIKDNYAVFKRQKVR